ncbi:MAG TPA: hypothetical protein PKZ32_11855, partial [Candidatus Melainabacteria bacterium]|nr:hypothetical protein [Candidatus Melainabacteria bacterium]
STIRMLTHKSRLGDDSTTPKRRDSCWNKPAGVYLFMFFARGLKKIERLLVTRAQRTKAVTKP